jgi:hypothetical protein
LRIAVRLPFVAFRAFILAAAGPAVLFVNVSATGYMGLRLKSGTGPISDLASANAVVSGGFHRPLRAIRNLKNWFRKLHLVW